MTILVTGVAGFIGSNLVDYLLDQNIEVVGIDNFSPYYARKLKEYNLSLIQKSSKFTFIEADLTSEKDMRDLVFSKYKIDAVANIAAWAGVTESVKQPRTYFEVNTSGVINLLELCREFEVKKFVQASTSSQYGDNPIPWTEDMPMTKLKHPYAASKRAAELAGYFYSENFGINFIATRFFNVYGPRQRPEMALPKMCRAAETGTEFPQFQELTTGRDYTYVTDICDGVYKALIVEDLKYEMLNLGNSSPATLKELVEAVEEVSGKKLNLKRMPDRGVEAEMTYADSSKAKKLIGFDPKYNIKTGVKAYWDWFTKQPEWYQHYNG